MKAPFTNDELNTAIAQFGPIDQTIVELQAVINARDAEITKLTSQLDEARRASDMSERAAAALKRCIATLESIERDTEYGLHNDYGVCDCSLCEARALIAGSTK